MEQKTARDHIKEAFGIISSLSVSGDAVDAVAAARFALKQAMLALPEQSLTPEGGNDASKAAGKHEASGAEDVQ